MSLLVSHYNITFLLRSYDLTIFLPCDEGYLMSFVFEGERYTNFLLNCIYFPLFCHVFQMPVDITSLSEEERKARMRKRDPKKDMAKRKDDEFEDDFKLEDYSKFWKKT